MKKILLILLLIGSYTVGAQNIDLSKDELMTKLCREWKTSHAMMDGMRISLQKGAGFDMRFNPDNTYSVSPDKTTGKWRYDAKGKYIELSVNNKVTSRIISISDNELVVIIVNDGSAPKDLANVRTYFIPK